MIPLALKIGDNTIPIPVGVKTVTVTGVALVDLRQRRVPLRWLNAEDFKEVRAGRVEFRGMPAYYHVDNGAINFWPCASHEWKIVLTIDDVKTQREIDAGTDAA